MRSRAFLLILSAGIIVTVAVVGRAFWVKAQEVGPANVFIGSAVFVPNTLTRTGTSTLMVSVTPTPRPVARCGEFIFCRDPEVYDEVTCKCINPSPVIIDVKGDGLELTDAANGIKFDIDANGFMERVGWTTAGSDDGFLFLDRNGNGVVDNSTELFGNVTPQGFAATPNGFAALALLDQPGVWTGNRDGIIDSRDEVFTDLRIWQDKNHNGISEPSELHTLPELEIESISLAYKESRRTDRHGNEFRYRAKVTDIRHSPVGRWAYDVLLVWLP